MNAGIVIALLGAGVLVVLGGLVGFSLAERGMDRQVRRNAEARKSIGAQWRALEAERARFREWQLHDQDLRGGIPGIAEVLPGRGIGSPPLDRG